MIRPHVDQIHCVAQMIALHPVNVYKDILELRQIVVQNVQLMLIVPHSKPASTINAKTLAPAPVELMPNVTYIVIQYHVYALTAILVIHLCNASLNRSSKLTHVNHHHVVQTLNALNGMERVLVNVLTIISEIHMKAAAQNVSSVQIVHQIRHVSVINVRIHARAFAV